MIDVVALAEELVGIASASRNEAAIADVIEGYLSPCDHLVVDRIGDNLVARTTLGRSRRAVVAGHLDTVPLEQVDPKIVDGELWGLGVVDMKGSLAAMVTIAASLVTPAVDISWIFYAREEIARSESGLREIMEVNPSLLDGDVALLGEPTNGIVEAGCQGTLHAAIALGGIEAHTARPFMGVNAIHRMSNLLDLIAEAPVREVSLDGVTYVEQIQAVRITGGRANNVVPGQAVVTVNLRFAPDRSSEEATAWLMGILEEVIDPALGDSVEIIESADGALPNLSDPLLTALVARCGGQVQAKVGWTDVATFAELGIPAANFGAGDPHLAHNEGEKLAISSLQAYTATLRELLEDPEQD